MSQSTLEKSSDSPRTAKHLKVAKMLGQRILHGDYVLRDFPTHRDLAEDVGVSQVTARRAIQHLVDEGLLTRQANGRPSTQRGNTNGQGTRSIALLTEGYPSPYLERWHRMIGQLSARRGWSVRVVAYSHDDDPLIQQTFEGFDGTFFMPSCNEPDPKLIHQLKQDSNSVVVINRDWSVWGVKCLWLVSPLEVQVLLDHLGDLGHQKIACLNTQPYYKLMEKRVQQYQLWMAAHGQVCELINQPVIPFEDAAQHAYKVMAEHLDKNKFDATALFCVTDGAAKGAYRAFYERGWQIGKDIAVCAAVDDGRHANLWCPSLTCIREADPKPYLDVCLDWFAGGCRNWYGPLLVQPARAPLFIGESTKNIDLHH